MQVYTCITMGMAKDIEVLQNSIAASERISETLLINEKS